MLTEELKKQTHFIDLVVQAGRKRQSTRTGFVHDEEVIPLYENFCYAFALFRQKTTDSVREGKDLIERLFAFQSADGNFPVFLHDFPRCFDFQMSLKVAPILIYLLRLFGSVLGDLKPKMEETLKKLRRPEKVLWENRYRACIGEELLPIDVTSFSVLEWTEWLITAQLAGQTHFAIPYNPDLQVFLGPTEIQERGEPRPHPIEYILADGQFSPRLMRDHPHQLLCAPLFPITFAPLPSVDPSFRLMWKGQTIHSLVAKSLIFDLPEGVEITRNDLFEVALFTDISPETQIFVEGRKATSFFLGDKVTIQTPPLSVEIEFELTQGAGDFCGHIFRANRPSQIVKGYEAFDWQIGLRTLRRSPHAQIRVTLRSQPSFLF